MKLNSFKLLPFAKDLLTFIQKGIDDGVILFDNQGIVLDEAEMKELIACKIEEQMKTWKPVYENKDIMDDYTRKSGARFLSGIVFSLLKK